MAVQTNRGTEVPLTTFSCNEQLQDEAAHGISDVYRGCPPQPTIITLPLGLQVNDGRSSTSSLTAPLRRPGRLAAAVELAITRWARARNSSASSSSSLPSSPRSSESPAPRLRFRKRRPSVGTLQTIQSEQDIASRIKWIKAREELRQIPREFTLYIPPSCSAGQPSLDPSARRITRSTSLPLILSRLDCALRIATKKTSSQRSRAFNSQANEAHCGGYVLPSGKIISTYCVCFWKRRVYI
jgi:magnesium transporter